MDFTDPNKPFIFLAGIASFGPIQNGKCGTPGWPTVYTVCRQINVIIYMVSSNMIFDVGVIVILQRVDRYTEWILSKMRT